MIYITKQRKKNVNYSDGDDEYKDSPAVSAYTKAGALGGALGGALLALGLSGPALLNDKKWVPFVSVPAGAIIGGGLGALGGLWTGKVEKDIWQEKQRDYKKNVVDPTPSMTPEMLLEYMEKNKELKEKFNKLLDNPKK